MAIIISAQSGLWSATTTWTGGVAPVSGDKIVVSVGHVVTYDVSGTYGDDTSTAITVGGTLKASRGTNTALTIRGQCVVTGTMDWGTEASPIPINYSAAIWTNDSATMGHNKWRIGGSAAMVSFSAWGATKTRETTVTVACVATEINIPVAACVNWQGGDIVAFEPPSTSATNVVYRTLVQLISGVPQINNQLGHALPVGTTVHNLSSNVRIGGVQGGTYGCVPVVIDSTVANSVELGEVAFVGVGSNNLGDYNSSSFVASGPASTIKKIKNAISHTIWTISNATVGSIGNNGQYLGQGFHIPAAEKIIVANSMAISMRAAANSTGRSCRINEITMLGCAGVFGIPETVAGNECVVDKVLAIGSPSVARSGVVAFNAPAQVFKINNGTFRNIGMLMSNSDFRTVGNLLVTNCDFSANATTGKTSLITLPSGSMVKATFDACTLPSGYAVDRAASGLSAVHVSTDINLVNINNDPSIQERYTYGGQQIRENTIEKRGTSSMRFDCWYSANPTTYSFVVEVAANQTINLRGSMRYATLYGTATPPKVTISGLGIVPVVATCPTTGADTWYDYSLTAVNPKAYPGKFTVTYTGQSAANAVGAYCYFDGVPNAPWVTAARHWGYLYDGLAYRTVDSRISMTEAAALALPVAVNHVAKTITLTGALTARQVFEACMADLAKAANLAVKDHLTSQTGDTFTTTYTVVMGGGGSTTGTFTDLLGTRVSAVATLPVSGCRIQLYNVTDGVELENRVVTGTAYIYNLTYSTAKVLRLRVAYQSGTAAKLPQEAFATLTTGGASFTLANADDTVYSGNGVDGSTCTEFVPDYPNLQIDANDADGVTSVQRLYAWSVWANAQVEGIRQMFNAITAQDSANYVIDVTRVNAKVQNLSTNPLIINGGYLRRSDGTTLFAVGAGPIQADPGRAYVAVNVKNAVVLGPGDALVTLNNGNYIAYAP